MLYSLVTIAGEHTYFTQLKYIQRTFYLQEFVKYLTSFRYYSYFILYTYT